MAGFSDLIDLVNGFIWGPWILVLFIGTGATPFFDYSRSESDEQLPASFGIPGIA